MLGVRWGEIMSIRTVVPACVMVFAIGCASASNPPTSAGSTLTGSEGAPRATSSEEWKTPKDAMNAWQICRDLGEKTLDDSVSPANVIADAIFSDCLPLFTEATEEFLVASNMPYGSADLEEMVDRLKPRVYQAMVANILRQRPSHSAKPVVQSADFYFGRSEQLARAANDYMNTEALTLLRYAAFRRSSAAKCALAEAYILYSVMQPTNDRKIFFYAQRTGVMLGDEVRLGSSCAQATLDRILGAMERLKK